MRHHDQTPRLVIVCSLLSAIACGPAGIGADATTGEQSTSTGTLESSTTIPTSTETTTDTTDTTTDTTGTDSSGFVPNYDASPPSCDSFAQDCPDGEKCVFDSASNWSDTKCVPIMGDQAPGESCWADVIMGTDNCDATSMCWNLQDVGDEALGTCALMCTGTPDDPVCPPGGACLVSSGPLALCLPTCDPLSQDCGVGLGCYWANYVFFCFPTTQDIPPGQPCEYINDCALGSVCLDGEQLPACANSACCSPFCDINAGDAQCDALPGTSCVAFFPDLPPIGYEHIGVCILP